MRAGRGYFNRIVYLTATLMYMSGCALGSAAGRTLYHEPFHLVVENGKMAGAVVRAWCGDRLVAEVISHIIGEVLRKDIPYSVGCGFGMHITTGTRSEVDWVTEAFHVEPGSVITVTVHDREIGRYYTVGEL